MSRKRRGLKLELSEIKHAPDNRQSRAPTAECIANGSTAYGEIQPDPGAERVSRDAQKSAPTSVAKSVPPSKSTTIVYSQEPQQAGSVCKADQSSPRRESSHTMQPSVGGDSVSASDVGRSIAEPSDSVAEVQLGDWRIVGDAVVGLAHRKRQLPCQDAVFWRSHPRPILALSDGAGSGAVSELGARALVVGITRLVMTLENEVAPWLDGVTSEVIQGAQILASRVLLHAQGLLEDLSKVERRNVAELRGTLLLAVFGRRQVFWWQVGDGAAVCVRAGAGEVLGDVSRAKGEHANQTCFVDNASIGDVQHGLLDASRVHGLALMSDGAAERLVSLDGRRVAARIQSWSDRLSAGALSALDIAVSFHEPGFVEGTTLDDRSIVLAARLIRDFAQEPSVSRPASYEKFGKNSEQIKTMKGGDIGEPHV